MLRALLLLVFIFVSNSAPPKKGKVKSFLEHMTWKNIKKKVKTVTSPLKELKGAFISRKLLVVSNKKATVDNCYYANVRKGPGIKFGVVATVKKGATFPFRSFTPNGWGWIKYEEPKQEAPKPVSTEKFGWVKVKTALNFRDAPWGKVIGLLYDQDKVTILDTEGKWYKVKVNGKVGYCHTDYITLEKPVGEVVTPPTSGSGTTPQVEIAKPEPVENKPVWADAAWTEEQSEKARHITETDDWPSGWCAGGVGDILEGLGLPCIRGNAHDWDVNLEKAGWTKVDCDPATTCPPGAVLQWDSNYQLGKTPAESGGERWGHVEVITEVDGKRKYCSADCYNNYGSRKIMDNYNGAWVYLGE
jgi:uncharacterized protein YraI